MRSFFGTGKFPRVKTNISCPFDSKLETKTFLQTLFRRKKELSRSYIKKIILKPIDNLPELHK